MKIKVAMEYWSTGVTKTGVMECWSNGVLGKKNLNSSPSNTPILHPSSTPESACP
jgi:hypothetical protein